MAKGKRNRQHGCRVALWFWTWLILSQVGAGLLLDYYRPNIRFPQAYQRFSTLDEVPHKPEILFLGSSRTESSIHDWVVSQSMRHFTGDQSIVAMNAHVPAGDLISAEYVWNGLCTRGAHPAILVIELCPEEVNHLNDWLRIHVLRQLRWEDVPSYAGEVCRTRQLLRLVQGRVAPMYTHRYELWRTAGRSLQAWLGQATVPVAKSIVQPGYQDVADQAERQQPVPPEYRAQSVSGLHDVERGLRDYRPGGCSTKALERILAYCRQQEIAVVLLGIPVSSPHRNMYSPLVESQFKTYMKHLEQTYPCRFVDCRDQIPDWLFRDNHHAVSLGGDYFSQRFAWEVLLPLWTQVKTDVQPAIASR